MNIPAITLIALGLAMDAFAVSIASGLAIKQLRVKHALRIAAFFGSFQAIMPVVGWLAGLSLAFLYWGIDHWVAFGLLVFVGCKMIYESIRMDSRTSGLDPLNVSVLLMLSFATSIDALAIGVSFAFLGTTILMPIAVIGTVTFLLSFFGVFLGNRLGHFFERKIRFLGGLILIGIGTNILMDHLLWRPPTLGGGY